MGRPVDYEAAKELLVGSFAEAEKNFRENKRISIHEKMAELTNRLFVSRTQAYREGLLGCVVARIIDPKIDVRHPVAEHNENAFSGRSLDERIVNPFLVDRAIPASKNPYLSSLRRGVLFVPGGARGQKDAEAFNALVEIVGELLKSSPAQVREYLLFLLGAFINLREASNIPLRKVSRLSLEQYGVLLSGLLATPSGGLMPVLLAIAMFLTIKDCFGLDWQIEYQGINVADAASGAGGDITVRRAGKVVLTVEVTERPIQRDRVVSTFNTKISPNGLDDYLFFYSATPPSKEARETAQKYFAQGHDINFISVRDWVLTTMTTIGPKCRAKFTSNCIKLLSEKGIPSAVKQTWNDQVASVVS